MNKCWISFYLSICPFFYFLTVQSQTIAHFTFTPVNNAVAAPVCVNPDLLTSTTYSTLTPREISGKAFTEIPFQVEHFNHPWPMRAWPENQNRRADVLFSFGPTQNKDWTIMPANNYTLKYRMFVYDGTISTAESKEIWKGFATRPEFSIKKINSNP